MNASRTPVRLDIAVADYPQTAGLKDGTYPMDGIDANFIKVDPIIAAYRRMVRGLEFDVCEMAPTTYMIARGYGAPYKALPIFVARKFHHGGLVCREDAHIKTPRDLEGKKVGVRAYSVTTGVWTRGILVNEFGLDDKKVTWVVDDEEHVTQLKLPANVIHVPEGKTLASMMAEAEIQAGFTARAGIGREGPPKAGWEAEGQKPMPQIYQDLFPNTAELEAEWYRRTKVYPMHGLIVIKDDVIRDHPHVPKAIYDAYLQAHDAWLKKLNSGEADTAEDKRYRELTNVVGADPLPYGIEANLPSIQAMHDYAFQQGLIPCRLTIDEMFIDPEA